MRVDPPLSFSYSKCAHICKLTIVDVITLAFHLPHVWRISHALTPHSSCNLTQVHRRAFENLKLIVELDFSWNRLGSIPLPQTRHLTLLRRLSMRGNPLLRLDDVTLFGGLPTATVRHHHHQQHSSSSGRHSSSPSSVAFREQLARLHETYPELTRALIRTNDEGERANRELIESLISIVNEAEGYQNNHHEDSTSDGHHEDGLDQQEEGNELTSGERTADLHQQAAAQSATTLASDELGEPIWSAAGSGVSSSPAEALKEPVPQRDNSIQAASEASASVELNLAGVDRLGLSLGLFEHLQELDLGECQLTYIKWTAMRHLRSLKRLQLDGNHLR